MAVAASLLLSVTGNIHNRIFKSLLSLLPALLFLCLASFIVSPPLLRFMTNTHGVDSPSSLCAMRFDGETIASFCLCPLLDMRGTSFDRITHTPSTDLICASLEA